MPQESEKQALLNYLKQKTTTFTFDEVGQMINIISKLQEPDLSKSPAQTPEASMVGDAQVGEKIDAEAKTKKKK